MKTRLRESTQQPGLFWVEGLQPYQGWQLLHPEPLSRKQAQRHIKSYQSGAAISAAISATNKPETYDHVRKLRLYLDEIDMMDGQLSSSHIKKAAKERIKIRKPMLIGYCIDLLREMK